MVAQERPVEALVEAFSHYVRRAWEDLKDRAREADSRLTSVLYPDDLRVGRGVLARYHQKGFDALDPDDTIRMACIHCRMILDDAEANPEWRIKQAPAVMKKWLAALGHPGLDTTTDPAVLGVAGEIYRMRWRRNARWHDLRKALEYNARGLTREALESHPRDYVFKGFFTAMCLDELAQQERYALSSWGDEVPDEPTGLLEESVDLSRPQFIGITAPQLRARADEVRKELTPHVAELAERKPTYWQYRAMLAALHMVSGKYEKARKSARRVETAQADDVNLQKWARELVRLAELRHRPPDQVRSIVEALLEVPGEDSVGDPDAVTSAFSGKIGLALSGGGFRAALFHVGVLARLAEMGVLERVEVISAVSGGAIVGTHYYLLLKELFESRSDEKIHRLHFCQVVHRLIEETVAGVGHDLRNRIYANPILNVRMLGNYSPSERLGDLLERHLLPAIESGNSGEGGTKRRKVRYLDQLPVHPLEQRTVEGEKIYEANLHFRPKHDNWRRKHKVPILILNATTLNTGHNWQFTARHMGEPPGLIHPEIDPNPRLRRIRWDRRPGVREHSALKSVTPVPRRKSAEPGKRRFGRDPVSFNVRVGQAVAASAAVPGVFEPLSLVHWYPGKTVQLSDGGVVDNQGISGLRDQGCDIVIVSDASGRLTERSYPGGGVGNLQRSNTISMQQVRAGQYDQLRMRTRTGLLKRFTYVHLTHGLLGEDIPHLWPEDESAERRHDDPQQAPIRSDIQESLADIRTDLDLFTETEAYALMICGYRMMVDEAEASGLNALLETSGEQRAPPRWRSPSHGAAGWQFGVLAKLVDRKADSETEEPRAELARRLLRSRGRLLRSPFHDAVFALLLFGGGLLSGLFGNQIADAVRYVVGWPLLIGLGVVTGIAWLLGRGRNVGLLGALSKGVYFALFGVLGMFVSWLLLVTNWVALKMRRPPWRQRRNGHSKGALTR